MLFKRLIAVLPILAISCAAQVIPQDHSCTVNFAGQAAIPSGEEGNNFNSGWGFQAGGGFAVFRPSEPGRGAAVYITANFMYDRLAATGAALTQAKTAEPTQLASATSAHGSFSAVTLDPTVRYSTSARLSFYGSGGFGWFRRAIGFNGANPETLTESNGITLGRLGANSGVFDLGGGLSFGLTPKGGLMLYAEARVYRGVTVNSGTTIVPLSVGVRW
jgi:hypothetical protein